MKTLCSAVLMATLALGITFVTVGCASDPEPAPQATAAEDLTLGLGAVEVTLTLDPISMSLSPAPGFDLKVNLCAAPADASAPKPCQLTVDLATARLWIQSISWTQITFAGVLPLRSNDITLAIDGFPNPITIGVGEGKCV